MDTVIYRTGGSPTLRVRACARPMTHSAKSILPAPRGNLRTSSCGLSLTAADPNVQRCPAVTNVAAKTDMGDPPSASLGVNPRRGHAKKAGHLVCREQLITVRHVDGVWLYGVEHGVGPVAEGRNVFATYSDARALTGEFSFEASAAGAFSRSAAQTSPPDLGECRSEPSRSR